ncbi:rhodanese-like domain-containing protein [Streptomyces antarcticus]|uniref:rhodanese-like domain-containing protein n=1 Tax=Streptomyces antarcticus TaxID=2996458 RepID=UPI00226F8C7F|nr:MULTISPECIES: rhodanese-like domain-containing protein [unclassified Streptomyces]MCY0944915.1 rhodanese-like domain-containing protein [Streptomyces sp. H34-AA3]MCY0949421.1 rhodanese-like domain-containing protein [Streptomyces sp. H27-S2]MCZ4083322.1 rhodanese-like domain-containing protein [Streptomyces sp. H34-S5]
MSIPATLTAGQVLSRHQEFTVIDVRTPGEYASGHLPGAVNIPLDRIAPSLPRLRRAAEDKGLLLVCATGARSENAARTLASHGIPSTSLTGGTRSWSAGGHGLDYPAEGRRSVWAMERQVRVTAGSLVLLGLVLGLLVHPAFQLLSAGIGAGLVFSAVTDTCGMALVLGRLPFNRRR